MKRGEIYYAVIPTDPSQKPRPVLIVSDDRKNGMVVYKDIMVVKITSLHRTDGTKKSYDKYQNVIVTLKNVSIIKCDSIHTLEKRYLGSYIQSLSTTDMNKIDQALKLALALP